MITFFTFDALSGQITTIQQGFNLPADTALERYVLIGRDRFGDVLADAEKRYAYNPLSPDRDKIEVTTRVVEGGDIKTG